MVPIPGYFMKPIFIFIYLVFYFLFISLITWLTTRKSDHESFYLGNKKSPWPLVAVGMIGTSISGVTFISVTGMVAAQKFSYIQFVLGLTLGYQVISFVLLPLYYRLQLTSIYTYLDLRFGHKSHKVGSFYFLVARTLGAGARLFLVVEVLNDLVFRFLGIPFELTVAVVIFLIFAYTVKGGIKTIVYTDTIQTALMLLAVVFSLWEIGRLLGHSLPELWNEVSAKGLNQVFTDGTQGFWKNFLSGFFICIGMTGLDQDLMQKNLSMKSIGDAQKNMVSFSLISFFVNLLFLTFGAFLALFIAIHGISLTSPDLNYGEVAMHYFSPLGAVLFIIGLVSISFSSSDSALTALTTSFCLDILGFKPSDPSKVVSRRWVHFGFCLLSFFLIIFLFKGFKNSVINIVYAIGSYTYGPLIGIYAFGLFIKRKVKDSRVPYIAILSALFIISLNGWVGYQNILHGIGKTTFSNWNLLKTFDKLGMVYSSGWGNEIIIYNAGLTFLGLLLFSKADKNFVKI